VISVEEARRVLLDRARSIHKSWPTETIPVSEAAGRILAEPIRTALSVPHFDNSAMDGFAVRSSDTKNATKDSPVCLLVVGVVSAGDDPVPLCEAGTALKIMTGAQIPSGADAVVPKEETRETKEGVEHHAPVPPDLFIRHRGEDLSEGDEVLKEGTRISIGAAGLLASIGVRAVRVARKPRVAILVTGRELVSDRAALGPGKVFESNSILLRNGLREAGCDVSCTEIVGDDPQLLRERAKALLSEADLLVVTGGVSVGDHDHTKEILGSLGVEELFWRVAQRPGKPLYAGFLGEKLAIALPGNPYAVFVGFFMYVRPALLSMMGMGDPDLPRRKLRLASGIEGNRERALWLKGKAVLENGEWSAEPLSRQGSHLLASLAEADLLIFVPPGEAPLGREVEVDVFELPA
jgi:molybdopterin molybdotransferase